MKKFSSRKEFELVAGGQNLEISYKDNYDYYLIKGGAGAILLGGNTFVLKTGETAIEGLNFLAKYEGDVVPAGGNNVVFFGTALSVTQSKKECWLKATYQEGAWVVDIEPDITSTGWVTKEMLDSGAFTVEADITTGTDVVKIVNAKSVADWWTNLKANVAQTFAQITTFTLKPKVTAFTGNMFLRSNASKEILETDLYTTITKEISFETGELGNNSLIPGFPFDIQSIRTEVGLLIEVTDDAIITTDINGAPVTTGVVTISAGSATNTIDSTTPTAAKTGDANAVINFVGTKVTPGGKAHLQITLKRVLS